MKTSHELPYSLNTLTLMKKILMFLLVSIFATAVAGSAFAQSPTYHQGWTMLEEHPSQIDVSYAVVQCTSTSSSEIYLHIFNENPTAQSVSFTLTIEDPATSNTSTYTVTNFSLSVAEMVKAECGSTSNSVLKTAVPSGFNPATLTVDISYN